MDKERLTTLSNFLRTVPPEKFDIGCWYTGPGPDAGGRRLEVGDCGTAACALGWATACPPLRAAGLFLTGDGVPACVIPAGPVFGFAAACVLFGMGYTDAVYLFGEGGYLKGRRTTPADVADRIDEVVWRLD